MKKTVFFVTFVLVFFVSVFSVSALRVGLEVGNPAAVIIIRPSPFDFKIGYNFAGAFNDAGGEFIHVSGDYRIIDSYRLVDFLHFYLGVGAFVQIMMGAETDALSLGGRIPVGLQAFLFKNTIEIFLEIVPTVTFFPTIQAFQDFQGYFGFTIKIPS
ncbi:MAG: DUF3996 domain-containing protein [Spirochaetales bacterium]|nr:DUF3996 domain-containing protein [Spirochaetales bacterium]